MTDLTTRLVAYLEETGPPSLGPVTPETRLFDSGAFDSLALVQLVGWVEAELDLVIESDALDFHRDWATVRDVVVYIERERTARNSPDR